MVYDPLIQGCQPYKVPPCVIDEHGHNSCEGKPTEHNHKCSKTCYGNRTVDYKNGHYKSKYIIMRPVQTLSRTHDNVSACHRRNCESGQPGNRMMTENRL